MRHPALRVADWRWLVPAYQRLIAESILYLAVPTLPFRPVRVELVGSMVRGCANLGSDFDLNLAARDWNEQVEWRRAWADPRVRNTFLKVLAPVLDPLGIRLDVAPNNPDQHTYDTTHDFITGRTSDRGAPLPDRTSRWWDGYQLKWLPKPLMAKELRFTDDPWEAEVEEWRAVHGARFLTYHRCPVLGPNRIVGKTAEGVAAKTLVADIPIPASRRKVGITRAI